jgi:hypothetical protein
VLQTPVPLDDGDGGDSLGQLHLERQGGLGHPANQCLSTKHHRCASASAFARVLQQSAASSAPRGFEAALARP